MLKIVRFTRCTLTYELNRVLATIKTQSSLSDVQPSAQTCQPKPKKKNTLRRKHRKKTIKVYGRFVRRPKRAVRTNQIRTIDIIDEPIEIPKAVVICKQEIGKKIII